MCTVSFIPISKDDFILTSNRDESPVRNTIAPQLYEFNNIKVVFPKDEVAGGTWIGASKRNRLICLLNGGLRTHIPKDTYRLSRGIIVTDLLIAENIETEIMQYNLEEIEPFTIILVDWEHQLGLFEFVWDGKTRQLRKKPLEPTIWSSSLLYSVEDKKKREQWFSYFLQTTETITEEEINNFHKSAGDGNIETDLIMDRVFVKTKSITAFSKRNDICLMHYEDLSTHKIGNLFL